MPDVTLAIAMDNWWKIVGVASPFVSAFLAAWITNNFATKRLKAEKFLDQRLSALQEIHSSLVAAKLHYSKALSRAQGNEHGIWPEGGYESHLVLKNLWECFQAQAIFLRSEEREAVFELMKEADMCNAMERAITSCPELENDTSTIQKYESMQLKAAEALAVLYIELKSEYGI